ncbi:transporter substrate-binding protein [Jiella avicenniae]|uniref:Transporter substrate-binding protein n=1 Tax=Jiella avicenniae TaxID=2907202 RepID=A0A9X1NW53_9HYPH|nr:transporter substrate-binding protein [Jiella avicenniae]MCE7026632.1 transporter substrate-binding protein [Jiella avicenniae]
MKRRVELGLLFSCSGNYQLLSAASKAGAEAGIAAVNADDRRTVAFQPVARDPEGKTDRYAPLCAEIFRDSSARHVVGCTTSLSRKEVIPVLEKFGGMLWYPCPYEGFEANEQVVYMHACPNQHLVPLLAHVIPRFGRNGFLLGSNYIWGWETNRVARDVIGDAGGEVLGERYLPLGDTDVSRLIAEIRASRPNFILNNLIGPSSYAFFEAYGRLGEEDGHFTPERCPILSCNLTEIELPAIGPAAEGHLSVGPWFAPEPGAASKERAIGPGRGSAPENAASSFYVAAHSAVIVLADLLDAAGAAAEAPRPAFSGRHFATPYGRIAIDPANQHASLPVKIARARGGRFEVVEESPAVVSPDPYLSRYDPARVFGRPSLRAVS